MIGDGTGGSGYHANDLVGTADNPIDPMLGPLQDNGGPTPTMALLPGSPALSAGDPDQLGVPDQRGVTGTGGVNIGAYQAFAATFLVAGSPAPITAGTSGSVTITARDPYGNTALGYRGTVHFTSSDARAGLPADYTFAAADNGAHTFGAMLKTAAIQSITATDTTTAAITGTQTGITVNPAIARSLVLSPFPTPVSASVSFTIMLTAQDAFGNVATGYTGTIHFSSTHPRAALPADYTFTAADRGTKASTVTLFTNGLPSVTATDLGNPSITGTQTGMVLGPLATLTEVAGPLPPAKPGLPVTLTAVVTSLRDGPFPNGGTATFLDNGSPLGPAAYSEG